MTRNRYQLIGAVIFAVALPAVLRNGLGNHFLNIGSKESTITGTFLAILLGAYLLRRMTLYPGTRSVAYILPAFMISYAIVIAVFFFLRLDYSRAQFLISFASALVWFGFVGLIEPGLKRLGLAVLPFGDAERIVKSDRADWVLWQSSGVLPTATNGIVVDLRADLAPEWERFLANAALAGVPVYHWKQMSESLTGMVDMEHLSENTFGSLGPSSAYLRVKRFADFVAALLAAPFFLLIAIPVALAVRLFDGSPVIFKQTRVGLGGRKFEMLKFRTMRKEEGGHMFTEPFDPRVTRIGGFLRRHRIDELPQIINILRGDMSWIGPRPEAVELAEWYEAQIPFYSYRHIVRPGVSGWAQVNQGNVAEIEAATTKLRYDFYYIKYFSPWLDVLIAAKTARIVLAGVGWR
ncbi:MAG: polyprenyl glycosylphosphotransferase [Hyphomicrobiales bacterium]|nr:polyprenyl glycosylphosphotransferase [Hyphomicrobiales bacterium]